MATATPLNEPDQINALFYRLARWAIEELPGRTDLARMICVVRTYPIVKQMKNWNRDLLAILMVQRIRLEVGMSFYDPDA
jgi:hypothetical protein